VSAIEDQSLGLKRAILTLLEDLLKGAVDSDMGRTFGSCLRLLERKAGFSRTYSGVRQMTGFRSEEG
jgi:hypothetical protein